MASNELPKKRDRLFTLGDDMCDAAHDHELAIGLKQNTESIVRPVLDAARTAESAFGQSQILRKAANAALMSADNAAKVFISRAKKRLSIFLGESYSTEWGAAGWPNHSLMLPSTQDERFSLVNSLKLYLTSNPTQESVDMGVTAILAATCYGQVSSARTVLDMKVTESGQAKAARDAAEANLRNRLRGLITELETILAPEDPLWHAFGLSRPVDEETPEAPTFTTALASVAGTVLVDWDDALRAERYRVWIQVADVDTDFRAIETVYDSDATLSGLTRGVTVKIRVTSVNEAGESLPGPVAEAVVA
jgi:hypothetical protein